MAHRKTIGKWKERRAFYKDDLIHLAFYPTGGLGDYIISKAVLEDILSCSKCAVTIYCDKAKFAHAVFRDVTEDIRDYTNFDFDLFIIFVYYPSTSYPFLFITLQLLIFFAN